MAAASLACCGLPLAAVGLGLGAGGAAVFLERYKWDCIGTAAVLLLRGPTSTTAALRGTRSGTTVVPADSTSGRVTLTVSNKSDPTDSVLDSRIRRTG